MIRMKATSALWAPPTNLGDKAYSLVSLKRKNLISVTPLKDALNAFIFALYDSAKAFAALWQRSSMPHRNARTGSSGLTR